MDVKFIEIVKYFNFYKENTKLVCFKSILDNIKVHDVKIGTSIGLYLFTFHAKLVYNSFSVGLDNITPYIISGNILEGVDGSSSLIHGSPYVFDNLARVKISGVNEVNPNRLLGDYMCNAKVVYDNPVASIKDTRYKSGYRLSIIVYWDKNGELHFAPYQSFFPLTSRLNFVNYRKEISDLLRVKRPQYWDYDDYLIYESIVSNFDISWL